MPKNSVNSQEAKKLRDEIKHFLKEGYTKSRLARSLEISRTTFLQLLDNPNYQPTDSVLGRARCNINWLKKSHGHELLECLTLLYCQRPDILPYFNALVQKAEQQTGFRVGYHGVVFGGPVGFLLFTSPGDTPLSDILSTKPFPQAIFGRTETMMIGSAGRYQGDHVEARQFYNQHPQARMYLKLFQTYSFAAGADLKAMHKLIEKYHKGSIYILEAGLLTGRYDYFMLVIAKDEATYLDMLTSQHGIYSLTSTHMTDSITLCVAPQGVRPLFTEGHFSLSHTEEQIRSIKTKRKKLS